MARIEKICTECDKKYLGTGKSEVCSGACRVKKMRRLQKEKGSKKSTTKKSKKPKPVAIIDAKPVVVQKKKKEIVVDSKQEKVIQDLTKATHRIKNFSEPPSKTNYTPNSQRKSPPVGLSKSEQLRWMRENG